MSKLAIDLEIAQTLGVPVALLLALADNNSITNISDLKSQAVQALTFLGDEEITTGITTISKFNLLSPFKMINT
jgi:hypothetical protein